MAAETIAFFEGQYMPLKDARISVTGSGRGYRSGHPGQ
jgi:hypothetical protein